MKDKITTSQFYGEIDYFLTEQALNELKEVGLITEEEKAEIHQLNLEKFNPYLKDLLV